MNSPTITKTENDLLKALAFLFFFYMVLKPKTQISAHPKETIPEKGTVVPIVEIIEVPNLKEVSEEIRNTPEAKQDPLNEIPKESDKKE